MSEHKLLRSKLGFSRCFLKLGTLVSVASATVAFLAWSEHAHAESPGLTLIDSFKVADKSEGFSEPSGLSLSNAEGFLWSVSDAEPKLHLLGIDGALGNSFKLPSLTGSDLEGVASRKDGSVLVLQETDRSILVVHPTNPIQLTTIPLTSLKGYSDAAELLVGNPLNKGPEGIAVDPESGRVFIGIEGQPRLLMVVSPELDEIVEIIPLDRESGFMSDRVGDDELDLSGLAWSRSSRSLWIVSDKSRQIFVYNPKSKSVKFISLTFTEDGKQKEVKHPEGIALDETRGLLYILTDDAKKSRLYVFEQPEL
ncbi:SdiA-regulated domain-containing protein [Ruegeria profundi]|uniref:SdiA-regulated domain-containing protein n=1 Tax=Ruegeria profundi TaxID=1685378 RepID=UPI001CD4D010|nr:SdiA-regulated domain-containing protein [Ruegeria profundi]MCA0930699.1 SdiA-regulated domain-containing protein [Ruegeria profundi]